MAEWRCWWAPEMRLAPQWRGDSPLAATPSVWRGAMPDLPPDGLIQTGSVAEAYWALHNQSRDGWTHELDLRPYSERW